MRRLFLMLVLIATPTLNVQAQPAPDPAWCKAKPFDTSDQTNLQWAKLGRDLFYDPILSGNKTVACATCHHPAFGTSDGVALAFGDGGIGLGPKRVPDPTNLPEQRIPRNAPALFNLGFPEFSSLFHDGRVELLPDGQIRTPLGPVPDVGALPILSALSGFPVLSPDEMAGHYSENPVAEAVRRGILTGPDGARQILADRVTAIDGYRARVMDLIGENTSTEYAHIAKALAIFMAHEWRADNSAFDLYLCSEETLPPKATKGMDLFYGKAACSDCHTGRFQTDHGYHAIATPQIGPGKAERFETHARDLGRMRVTGRDADAYKFRTPSLRNVALTAPYGHSGAYADLESIVRHHLDPVGSLYSYKPTEVALGTLEGATDFEVLRSDDDMTAIADANELQPVALSDEEIEQVIAFLNALTDREGIDGRLGIPEEVPSGLPVPRP